MFFQPMTRQMSKPKGKRGTPIETDYYDTLQISKDASEKTIKKAYHKKANIYHPDKKGGDATTFSKVLTAYEVLSDIENRECYDAYGADFEKIPGIEVFKNDLKSKDVVKQIEISIENVIKGQTIPLSYQVQIHGITNTKSIELCIPPYCSENNPIIFEGKGNLDSSKPIPGNLVVVVKTLESNNFKRAGNCLLHKKTLNIIHCLLGKPFNIRHPNGEILTICPENDQFNQNAWYMVEGQGIDKESELFIQIETTFPTLTDKQRRKLEKLFKIPPTPKNESKTQAVEILERNIQEKIQSSSNFSQNT
jgi:DnaJ-class molecular chaperone